MGVLIFRVSSLVTAALVVELCLVLFDRGQSLWHKRIISPLMYWAYRAYVFYNQASISPSGPR